MVLAGNWIVILFTLYPLYKSARKILCSYYSILHLCVTVFWMMQVLPILMEMIFGLSDGLSIYTKMYLAMQDEKVAILYDIFCIIVIFSLYFEGNRFARHHNILQQIAHSANNIKIKNGARLVLFTGMFLVPLFSVILAPEPRIYLKFSYFYMNDVLPSSIIYLYDVTVMTYVNYIAFGSTMILYLIRKRSQYRYNLDIILSMVIYTWLDGKRALLIFSLIGILAIDVIKQNVKIKKIVTFGLIAVFYFIIYVKITGKGEETNFVTHYFMYYSRMNTVKTAIYSLFDNTSITQYPGQTIIFDLLFFIPRRFWSNKPVMFCKYFTTYTMNKDATDFLAWNLQVNIWTEFISNFGMIIGIILSLVLVKAVVNISEKSDHILVFLLGMVFIMFYFMFGFETLALMAYSGWICALIMVKIISLLRVDRKRRFIIN